MHIPGYRIRKKISEGGMSSVYLAQQDGLQRDVALKILSPIFKLDPASYQRFQREANIVGQLSHPNIVSIYDVGSFAGLNYLAMDYLAGGSLLGKIGGGMELKEIFRVVKAVAQALEVAHAKGFIHRDIKPENILFSADNTVVLSDFGIAKALKASTKVTVAGIVIGTPHYMSPEQSRGQPLDGRSDIYSLGIVFYEMLTGKVPYDAEEGVAIAIKHVTAPIPTLSGRHAMFQPLLERFIAKRPRDRFQNGSEIIAAIEAIENSIAADDSFTLAPAARSLSANASISVSSRIATRYIGFKMRVTRTLLNLKRYWHDLKEGFAYWRDTTEVMVPDDIDSNEAEEARQIAARLKRNVRLKKIAHYYRQFAIRGGVALVVLGITWSAVSIGFFGGDGPSADRSVENFGGDTKHTATGEHADNSENVAENVKVATVSAQPLAMAHPIQIFLQRRSAPRISPILLQQAPLETKPDQPAKNLAPSLHSGITPHTEATVDQQIPASTQTEIRPLQTEAVSEPTDKPAAEHSALETLPLTQAEIPTFTLTVTTEPEDARVRILSIKEKYRAGIPLEPGPYSIEVSKPGFNTVVEWRRVRDKNLQLHYRLQKTHQAGDIIVDTLRTGVIGPEMVVLPTGVYMMGKRGVASTSPVRQVSIGHTIAMSKYEVTFALYQQFAEDLDINIPDDSNWGRGSRPVVNVTWQDAINFATWLSAETGQTYRLPTEAEWEFAARGGTDSDYWWGDTNPKARANCKHGCDSQFAKLFSSKSAPVGSFPSNPFGLYDMAGNVAEWVADCFQNHYLGAPKDGSAVSMEDCQQRVIRGGAMNDSYKALYSYARQAQDAGTGDNTIGFRLVRELTP